MAGRINLKLLTDFFNKIGPQHRLLRDSKMSEIGVKAEMTGVRPKQRRWPPSRHDGEVGTIDP